MEDISWISEESDSWSICLSSEPWIKTPVFSLTGALFIFISCNKLMYLIIGLEISDENLEDLLAYDDLFLQYFNAFLSLPVSSVVKFAGGNLNGATRFMSIANH